MADYLLAYHGSGMAETKEERARVMAAWGNGRRTSAHR
jgi:hypothetical protein